MGCFQFPAGEEECWKSFNVQSRRRGAAAESVMKQSAGKASSSSSSSSPRLCLCQQRRSARLPAPRRARWLTERWRFLLTGLEETLRKSWQPGGGRAFQMLLLHDADRTVCFRAAGEHREKQSDLHQRKTCSSLSYCCLPAPINDL